MAPADVDAFMRRINTPPRLDKRPERASGRSYTLTGDYWNTILSRPGRAPVDAAATYYPEGGIVRASQGGQDAWLALDLRQQAILARYIRLTNEGALSTRPGLLNVLTAAAGEEDLTVEVDGGALTADQVGALWGGLANTGAPQFLDTPDPPLQDADGYWLVFGLDEGRALQLFYEPGSPGHLTDALGEERYNVSPALASVLDGIKATPHPIDDKSKPGSYAWWMIMLGGGILCLGGALWLTKHPLRLPARVEALFDRFSPHL